MKIVICSHDYPNYVSGPNVWLLRFIEEVKKYNIDCEVLFTRGGDGKEYNYITAIRERGVPCYVYKGYRYSESIVRWILNTVKHTAPDIFIANFDLQAYYAARWIKEGGIPTIGVIRSDAPLYDAYLDEFVFRQSPFTVSGIVCVSKYLEDKVLLKNPPDVITRRIPSGTPVPRESSQRKTSLLKLIYAGRLTEEAKKISETTLVLCKVVRIIPDTEVTIYGSGNEEDKVRRIIETEGKGYPIKYAGWVSSNDLQSKLLEGHAFVLLSDYEGMPTSLMEAMACGLVPISLDIRSGIPELVVQGETGLLVKNRGDDFLAAVKQLQGDISLWKRLSANARAKIIKEYSIQSSVSRWLHLVDELRKNINGTNRTINIPKKIKLPPQHPYMRGTDIRWPGYFRYYGGKLKTEFKKSVSWKHSRL